RDRRAVAGAVAGLEDVPMHALQPLPAGWPALALHGRVDVPDRQPQQVGAGVAEAAAGGLVDVQEPAVGADQEDRLRGVLQGVAGDAQLALGGLAGPDVADDGDLPAVVQGLEADLDRDGGAVAVSQGALEGAGPAGVVAG